MRKIVLALSLLFICHSASHAQVIYSIGDQNSNEVKAPEKKTKPGLAFGPEAGVNMANMTVKTSGSKLSTSFKAGLAAGIVIDYGFSNNLYLQPGIFYLMNGCNVTGGNYSINTIQLPINVVYKLNKPGGNRLFFGIGPYIAYNLSGTQPGGTLKIGSDSSSDIKALDIGAGLNIGYQLAKGLYARAHYQVGFVNLGTGSSTITTSAFGITVGYLLGGKPKMKKPDVKAPSINK